MFGALFNKNKRKWFNQLADDELTQEVKFVIVNFLIKDNISFEQYIDNQKANNVILNLGSLEFYDMANSLSVEKNQSNNLNPSPSFKKYFSDNFDRPLGLSDWFIIGYPDVAGYFTDNLNNMEAELNARQHEFSDADGRPNFKCYRYLIDRYKARHSLELKIK